MKETFVNLHVDKDAHEDVASKLHVGGIPDTLFLTGDGKVVFRIVGYLPPAEFLPELKKAPERLKKWQELAAAVEKDAKDGAAQIEIGKFHAENMFLADAEKALRLAVEADKENAKGWALEAWWALAEAHAASEEPDVAVEKEALAKVQELDPKNAKGRKDNADVKLAEMLENSDPKAAREAYEKVVADWPGTDGAAEAMFMIGASFANLDGNFDEAEARMKKLAEAMPESEWAKKVPFALEQIAKMRKQNKKKK